MTSLVDVTPLRAYSVVLLSSASALVVTLVLEPWLAGGTFSLFLVATLVSAWYGGFGPGFAAAGLTALENVYFFLPFERSFASTVVRLILFLVSAALAVVIAGRLRAAQRGAEAREATAREAEKERARGETRFRDLLELAPDGIVIVDRDGRIVLANTQAHRMFAYETGALVGQAVERLVPERVAGVHVGHRDAYHRQPRTRPMGSGLELSGRRKDGTEFPVEISLSPLQTDEGVLVTSVIRDVGDRKRAEQQIGALNRDLQQRVAEQAAVNRELEAFSYSVSHDLRAPLRAIDGFSQALLEEHGDRLDSEGKEYLARVRAAAQRMAELIDDLLDLSRVTRREMRRERVNLTGLARTIVEQLRRSAPDRMTDVVIAEGLTAEGDPHLLRVALENLLGNAWKFTGRQPQARITLDAERRDGLVTYCVADNGVGFDMAYADKLFGAFQRLHAMHEFPGTGIGLATVQRIVHRHGGRVWAVAGVGEGARFYFTLSGHHEERDGSQDDPAGRRQS